MRKVLFLIPHLDYSGAARQLLHLIHHLPRHEFEPRVCVLGREGPWARELTEGGVSVELLRWNRLLELKPLLRLRDFVGSYQPDVIHAWGLPALRAVTLVAGVQNRRLVVSNVPPSHQREIPWLDHWLLSRAAAVTTGLWPIAPAVVKEPVAARPPGVPASARLLVGVGPLEPEKGFRDAIWAIDMLRFLYDDLHLVLVGSGSDRLRLERFARIVQMVDRIHFVGREETVAPWLAAAEVVWVPSHVGGGVNAALEAMSLGRPVIATRVPGLADVVVDGETGFLIRPGDKARLARQTRLLLDDRALRRRLGEAGRERVRRVFSAEVQVRRYVELYRESRGAGIA